MDWQDAFNILFGGAAGLGTWVLGRISKTLDRLDDDIRAMPNKYVSKEDYRADMGDIKDALRRIEDKLDGKADK